METSTVAFDGTRIQKSVTWVHRKDFCWLTSDLNSFFVLDVKQQQEAQSEHVFIIVVVFCVILTFLVIAFIVNCMRKIMRDHKIIRVSAQFLSIIIGKLTTWVLRDILSRSIYTIHKFEGKQSL